MDLYIELHSKHCVCGGTGWLKKIFRGKAHVEPVHEGREDEVSIDVGKILKKYSKFGFILLLLIPIILSIDSENTLFAINLDVAPANQEISKGEATKTNLKFFSLIDTKPHTVLVNYEIRNLEGKSVVSEQNEIIVTLTSSITEIINLPEKIDSGEYVFTAILTSEESLTSASYVFSVDAGKKTDLFFSIWTLLFFILVFVIIVFVLIGYMFYERNKLFSKLKNQQVHQISFYSNQINKQQKNHDYQRNKQSLCCHFIQQQSQRAKH